MRPFLCLEKCLKKLTESDEILRSRYVSIPIKQITFTDAEYAASASRHAIVFLSALHPMSPFDSGYLEARDRALLDEAEYLMKAGELALMAGDLNMTSWTRGISAIEGQLQ
jgi:hypothetical protein